MISVDIPKDIREYKEKLAFGLTLRQMVATGVALVICVPLYFVGRNYISEDLLSWIVIAVALPCVGIGFIKKNGMPFEKYAAAVLKQQLIFPQKTKFKTDNFFREMQEEAEKEDMKGVDFKKLKKYKQKATLERIVLMVEAEEAGTELDMKDMEENLLTVRKPKGMGHKSDKEDKGKDKEKKEKAVKKSRAQEAYEAVEEKRRQDPNYVPSKAEGRLLMAYAKELQEKRKKEILSKAQEAGKKNAQMQKRRTAKTFIPKSTQDDIPYIADYDEGLFEVEPNKYSKCYVLRDINYLTAKEDEQLFIFSKLGEFYNYFGDDVWVSLCIDNHIVSLNEQEQKIFFKLRGDQNDMHRKEYNKILKKALLAGNNEIQKGKYLTVTIDADSPYEAILRFHKIDLEVDANLRKIGTSGRVMTTEERLSLLHDKFRRGREGEFKVDFEQLKKSGASSKDYIAPSSFWFRSKDYFLIEDTYYRCMYINNLPATLQDEFLFRMTECDFPVIFNMAIQPLAQDKALRMVKKQLTGMEANKIEAEKKAVRAGYSPETINHDLKHSLIQGEELLYNLLNGNQKLFLVSLLMMTSAESLEALDENTKILMNKARAATCQIQNFDNQQREAFKVTLPMGITPNRKLFVERALTTNSTAIFMPFASQELFQLGGHYYGLNQITGNLVLCDRTRFKTPSGFVLGSSGSGKSFACKRSMLNVLLGDNETGLLVIDPEGEYTSLAKAFGGTILSLSASSDCHINPMDMDINYGLDDNDDLDTTPIARKKEKALQKKTEYLMSIVQNMLSDSDNRTVMTPQQRSIIDRAIQRTYKDYFDRDFDPDFVPTLLDLQRELDNEKMNSEDGRLVAEAVEYFTKGSMNLFSHKSNLDFENRFVVFSIRDLGKELQQISLLIVLDFIWNRMIANYTKKVRTYCYIDEIHVLFKNPFSESYIQQLYKRGRKYGLVITGITQDCEELLRSDMARGMISNSDFVLMLNQSSENLKLLVKLLHISDAQANYVIGAEKGTGLLFAEKTIVPFSDQFPESSYLYTLLSTKFGEGDSESAKDIEKYIERIRAEQEEKEMLEAKELQEQENKLQRI